MFYGLTIKYNKNDKSLSKVFYDTIVNDICTKGNFTWHKTTYEMDSKQRLHVHCILENQDCNIRYKPFFRKGYMIYFRKIWSSNWSSYIKKDIRLHSYLFEDFKKSE